MCHVLYTGTRWVMTNQDIIPIIVVNRWVSIHNLCENISAYLGEISAEQDANIRFEPSETGHKLMDMSNSIPFQQQRFIQQIHNMGFLITNISNRAKSKIFVQIIFNSFVSFTQCNMHLNSSLAVPDIMYFLLSDIIHIFKYCRQILISHVLERKFPKGCIFIRVIFYMLPRMFVTTAVPKPDIISCIGQHKCWGFVFIIDDPSIGGIKQPMLQEYWFKTLFYLCGFSLQSEYPQDISIGCGDIVNLDRVVEVATIISEIEFGLRVLFGLSSREE